MRRPGYLFTLILVVILVILPGCGRFFTVGTVNVNATLDGAPWSGAVDYSFVSSERGKQDGFAVPQSWENRIPTGTYTLYYHSGGPSDATLASITPSATQTLSTGGTVTFTLNFSSAVPSKPVVKPSPIIFTAPAELPPAMVGVPYSYCLCQQEPALTSASDLCGGIGKTTTNPRGGHPPYSFFLGSGVGFLPFGISLNLNGLLAGTPKAEGTSTFQVCVKDLDGFQACQTTSLTVKPAPTEEEAGLTREWVGRVVWTEKGPFATCTFARDVELKLTQEADVLTGGILDLGGSVVEGDPLLCFSVPIATDVETGSAWQAICNGTVSGSTVKFGALFWTWEGTFTTDRMSGKVYASGLIQSEGTFDLRRK